MNKKLKTGILLILLVVPVLLFTFLKVFGKNHYSLPIIYAKDSVKVDGRWKVTKADKIPQFEFIDQKGKKFDSKKDLKGKIYVTEFFFTTCGSICPVMSNQLQRLQDKIKDKPVLILSHTIDPEKDTQKVLDDYAQRYEANYGQWYFLTGDKKKIYDLALKDYKVNALDVGDVITPDFAHTSKLTLVDTQGRIRGYYTGTDPKEIDRLATEIDILLQEKE